MHSDFHLGQRWISESEPELGLGEIVKIAERTITTVFHAAEERRVYASKGAPLRRVRFRPGDKIRTNQNRALTVQSVHEKSGLLYYGYRYYSPREGRFLGRDPIGEQGGANLYAFCGNDGINRWDYLGQLSLKGFLKGPYEKRPALDEVVQMMGGLAYMTGPSGRPLRAGTSVIDIVGGMFGAFGTVLALKLMQKPEFQALMKAEVLVLEGGNLTWINAGLELEKGPGRLASPPLDRYKRPYEGTNVDPAAMQAYLDWEFGLVEQLGKDGTHHFWVL